MPAQKGPEQQSGKPQPQTQPPPPAQQAGVRKPWKKKSPAEVVLDQAEKLKEEIAAGEADLKRKKLQLAKFEEVRKIFESS